jgi:hypothetical protein
MKVKANSRYKLDPSTFKLDRTLKANRAGTRWTYAGW